MTKRGGYWATATAIVLLMAGCSTPAENEGEAPNSAARTVETPTVEQTTEPTEEPVDITAPGEVCDPQSGDDFPCLVAYPDQAVINMTAAPRAFEPLSSMPEDDRVELAREACAVLESGGTSESTILIETVADDPVPDTANNFAVFSAGAAAFCPDYAEAWVQEKLSSYTGR